MLLECWYASITDVILRVRWFKYCSRHMYASIKADALIVCLFKDCSFQIYVSIKVHLSGYAPIMRLCFYNTCHLRVRWCKDCYFNMYAFI